MQLNPFSSWLFNVMLWGAIFGAVAHAATRGQRDFRSSSGLQASEYAVNVTAPYAEQARQLLGQGGGQAQNPW